MGENLRAVRTTTQRDSTTGAGAMEASSKRSGPQRARAEFLYTSVLSPADAGCFDSAQDHSLELKSTIKNQQSLMKKALAM
ncbi:MAG: hypothetical protein DMG71_16830 [Acidobacteria bacterium]|nr:MAG: hypothetical protein DMG71_16830 [Acidobacteriota bacterium]